MIRLRKQPLSLFFFSLGTLLITFGCTYNPMRDQPRYEPLESSSFFPDNTSARPLMPGTVPNNYDVTNEWFYTGKTADGQYVDAFPFPVTMDVLKRGQERFNIYCSPCHGLSGMGDGMIVQRGFSHPPSYHQDRLRNAPIGHFVDVITNGYGQMYSYAYRVKPADRWAIAAYIRALQLSQNATINDVPAADQQQLEAAP
jgi:mono/diheme cytochrome c family protein